MRRGVGGGTAWLRGKLEQGTLPSFLVIGGQRCGTTSLYQDLQTHPQVRAPRIKEVQYFTLHPDRSLAWYAGHFPRVAADEVTFEASPYYLFHPDAPARAAAALPEARFVALLRDPVERAYSHYLHSVRNGVETLGFEQALAAEPGRLAEVDGPGPDHRAWHRVMRDYSYLARGRYAAQLLRWQQAVGSDRLWVVRSEVLHEDPSREYGRLLDFVGLPPHQPPRFSRATLRRDGDGGGIPSGVREWVREQLREDVETVRQLLGWPRAWS